MARPLVKQCLALSLSVGHLPDLKPHPDGPLGSIVATACARARGHASEGRDALSRFSEPLDIAPHFERMGCAESQDRASQDGMRVALLVGTAWRHGRVESAVECGRLCQPCVG